MSVLVWVEHDGSAVKDATLAAVTAAGKLGEVHALVAGQGVDGVAQAAAKIAGVAKVHVADDAAYGHALAENVAPLIAGLMANHDAFVAPATTTGKNVAPRVAALLDVMQVSDILSVAAPFSFRRMASSTAISSNGFMLILTLARSTPVPSAFTRGFTL